MSRRTSKGKMRNYKKKSPKNSQKSIVNTGHEWKNSAIINPYPANVENMVSSE